jgi:uncharacterized protein YjbJ (UPF0337 family)
MVGQWLAKLPDHIRFSLDGIPSSNRIAVPLFRTGRKSRFWTQVPLIRLPCRHSAAPGTPFAHPFLTSPCFPFPRRRLAMNWDTIKGNWKQMAGKAKQKWGKLTDDDLTMIAGKRDELAGILQKKYGYGKDMAEKELNDFTASIDNPGEQEYRA